VWANVSSPLLSFFCFLFFSLFSLFFFSFVFLWIAVGDPPLDTWRNLVFRDFLCPDLFVFVSRCFSDSLLFQIFILVCFQLVRH